VDIASTLATTALNQEAPATRNSNFVWIIIALIVVALIGVCCSPGRGGVRKRPPLPSFTSRADLIKASRKSTGADDGLEAFNSFSSANYSFGSSVSSFRTNPSLPHGGAGAGGAGGAGGGAAGLHTPQCTPRGTPDSMRTDVDSAPSSPSHSTTRSARAASSSSDDSPGPARQRLFATPPRSRSGFFAATRAPRGPPCSKPEMIAERRTAEDAAVNEVSSATDRASDVEAITDATDATTPAAAQEEINRALSTMHSRAQSSQPRGAEIATSPKSASRARLGSGGPSRTRPLTSSTASNRTARAQQLDLHLVSASDDSDVVTRQEAHDAIDDADGVTRNATHTAEYFEVNVAEATNSERSARLST